MVRHSRRTGTHGGPALTTVIAWPAKDFRQIPSEKPGHLLTGLRVRAD